VVAISVNVACEEENDKKLPMWKLKTQTKLGKGRRGGDSSRKRRLTA
jgi:hypothetical protein